MLRQITILLMLVSSTLALQEAWAEGDPQAGRELAKQWCSRCHDIEPGGVMKQQPPSFAAIAVYRSREYIQTNIMLPHSNMPEIAQILGLNVADLTAYITSLEQSAK